MACKLEMDGTIAEVRVRFSVRDSDGDEVPYHVVLRERTGVGHDPIEGLREELTGIVRRAFDTRDVGVASVSFGPGSVIAALVLVGSIVIETGAFLSGLREIRDAADGPIGRFIERSMAREGRRVSAVPLDTDVIIGTGAIEAGVEQPGVAPAPSTGAPQPLRAFGERTILILASALLVAVIIIALILAGNLG